MSPDLYGVRLRSLEFAVALGQFAGIDLRTLLQHAEAIEIYILDKNPKGQKNAD